MACLRASGFWLFCFDWFGAAFKVSRCQGFLVGAAMGDNKQQKTEELFAESVGATAVCSGGHPTNLEMDGVQIVWRRAGRTRGRRNMGAASSTEMGVCARIHGEAAVWVVAGLGKSLMRGSTWSRCVAGR